ncbi:aldo/keto reductase [Piscinibacter sp. XHJ-5]|uniref:aldo/keto reductase n=1 Tax=Piscinibacter sp. XHJ-5 TaxID=3037797 RepID=UPI0032979783
MSSDELRELRQDGPAGVATGPRHRQLRTSCSTKFSNGAQPDANRLVTGNSRKALAASVDASLRRLKTDRIDVYWVRHLNGITPIEEIVRGFDDLVRPRQGSLRRARTSQHGGCHAQ